MLCNEMVWKNYLQATSLMDELRVEPANDEERADKFKIYEQCVSSRRVVGQPSSHP